MEMAYELRYGGNERTSLVCKQDLIKALPGFDHFVGVFG